MLHPRYIRYSKQALLFAVIWLLFGFVYSMIEQGILGNLDYYPSTKNRYDFNSSLIYSSFGSFLIGFIHGWVEVSWLNKKFGKNPLWVKIVLKTLFYLLFIILFLSILSFAINSNRFDASLLSPEVIQSFWLFIGNFSFWSVVVFIGFGLTVAMLFAELASYLGDNIFLNFLFGKYHTPRKEIRIFMFLDMKSSTTIAEKIGHAKYFELLKDCYADMSNAILETSGEIYQYVGDEIVVSWPEKIGLYKNNCIECFSLITKTFEKRKNHYTQKYGGVPLFKAGFHVGLVTTGEIGVVKKEIIYTGDILNTTARIQGECNTYKTVVLISEQLVSKLDCNESFWFKKVAKLQLRGKMELIQLYTLD
jgi:adenylate cyclase